MTAASALTSGLSQVHDAVQRANVNNCRSAGRRTGTCPVLGGWGNGVRVAIPHASGPYLDPGATLDPNFPDFSARFR